MKCDPYGLHEPKGQPLLGPSPSFFARALGALLAVLAVAPTPLAAQTEGTWGQVPITGSAVQTGATSVIYDPSEHRKILVCGDICNNFCFSSRVSVLNLGTNAWSEVVPTGTAPPTRFIPILVYDSSRQRIVMFGGSYRSDTQVWELKFGAGGTMSWAPLTTPDTPPAVRYGSLAGYDAVNDRMLIYGGTPSAPNEVLAFNFADDTWGVLTTTGTPPASSSSPIGIHDAANDRFVMKIAGQTWQLGSLSTTPTWTHFAIFEPPPSGGTVFDSNRNRMLVQESATREWTLDLTNPMVGWRLLTIDGPPPSDLAYPIYDPVGDRVVVERMKYPRFGIPQETWALNLHTPFPTSVSVASASFGLEPPRPNPTAGNLACAFSLASAGAARLELFDVAGRRVLEREVGGFGTGTHRVELTLGGRLSAGVYTIALSQSGRRATRRIVVSP
jgi:hypothetical protein